jgi:hypothetical protein
MSEIAILQELAAGHPSLSNAIDRKLLAFFQLMFRFPVCNPRVTKFVAVVALRQKESLVLHWRKIP